MTKKALVVGCNYPQSEYALRGCVRDCKNHARFALDSLGVPRCNITVLADGSVPGFKVSRPTKENILAGLQSLVDRAAPGDMLYFAFSGHGTQVPDDNGDEEDGFDEAIVPGDFDRSGRLITDDELNYYMVQPLPDGVLLTCVFDACTSGTIMDLTAGLDADSMRKVKAGKRKYGRAAALGLRLPWRRYLGVVSTKKRRKTCSRDGCRGIPPVMNYVRDKVPKRKVHRFAKRRNQPACIFCFSGCEDGSFSYETTIDGKRCGVLSHCFIKTAEENKQSNYKDLFKRTARKVGSLIRDQDPQLSYIGAEPHDVMLFRTNDTAPQDDVLARPEKRPRT